METDKLITLVVPVRNRADIVLRTLDSIYNQSYRPLQLIVVDNASTDNTVEKITEWRKTHHDINCTVEMLSCLEPGAPNARNFGLKHVTTPWVMFFDSDDEMRSDHIAKVVREINENPECELIYFDATVMDADGWSHPMSVHDTDVMRGHLFHCALSTQRMAIRTDLAKRVGGWDQECGIWDDLELGVRLLLATGKVRKLHGDPLVVIHPMGNDSVTGSDYASRTGKFESVLDKIDSHFALPQHNAEHLWIECRRMILAAMYVREGQHKLAADLRRNVLERHSWRTAVKLHAVYATQRLLGHGGSAIAIQLFKKSKEKAE